MKKNNTPTREEIIEDLQNSYNKETGNNVHESTVTSYTAWLESKIVAHRQYLEMGRTAEESKLEEIHRRWVNENLEVELKCIDVYLNGFSSPNQPKDAGHSWIAFSDKWQAFKKAITSIHTSQFQQPAQGKPLPEEDAVTFILDIQDAIYAYMSNNKKPVLRKKDLTEAAKFAFAQIERRLNSIVAPVVSPDAKEVDVEEMAKACSDKHTKEYDQLCSNCKNKI